MSTAYSTAYSMNTAVRGVDLAPALAIIRRQRTWKLVGAMAGFLGIVVALLGTEALMLSDVETPAAMVNPQPGQPAPYTPDD